MFQIRIVPDGLWHRRKVGGEANVTACGEPFGAAMSRDWKLDADLCPICFTKSERTTGEFKRLERERDERDLFDDSDQTTDPDGVPAITERTKKPTKPP